MDNLPTKCSNPISLTSERVDTRTGELSWHDYEKPCGTRVADKCPHCSNVYRHDAYAVLRAGLKAVEGSHDPFTFITFTAPGADVFGQTHSRRTTGPNEKVKKCLCGAFHEEDDQLIGSAIDPSTYRYDKAADFNAHASRLLAVTLQRLGRVSGRKLSYSRVAEFQARGLIHFHVIVKGVVTDRSVDIVVNGGRDLFKVAAKKKDPTLRLRTMTKKASSGGWSWGPQVNVQRVFPGGKFGVGAYMVKVLGYAVKSTGGGAAGNYGHQRKMTSAAVRTCHCEKGMDCARGSHLTEDGKGFYQSKQSDRFCRRHQLAYNGWGFRGHILAFSRNWGMTFREVRAKRTQYAKSTASFISRFIIIGWKVNPRGSPTS